MSDQDLQKAIGAAARAARTARGVTQADVAEHMGIAVDFYARLERGVQMPSVATLVAMANALGISVNALVAGDAAAAARALLPRYSGKEVETSGELRRLLRRLRGFDEATLRTFNQLAIDMVRQRRAGRKS